MEPTCPIACVFPEQSLHLINQLLWKCVRTCFSIGICVNDNLAWHYELNVVDDDVQLGFLQRMSYTSNSSGNRVCMLPITVSSNLANFGER